MAFWEKIRKDAQKGLTEGFNALKLKAEELTEEGKKKYKLFELKSKVHQQMADLGGTVYHLSSKVKNPLEDKKVKEVITRLKNMEDQIKKLEGKAKKKVTKAKKKATKAKKKATKTAKKTVKKVAKKKTAVKK